MAHIWLTVHVEVSCTVTQTWKLQEELSLHQNSINQQVTLQSHATMPSIMLTMHSPVLGNKPRTENCKV